MYCETIFQHPRVNGLVTNYGEGGYKTEGGGVSFIILRKGGGGGGVGYAEGGHNKFWGSFYTVA